MKRALVVLTLMSLALPAWGQDLPGFQNKWSDTLKLAKEQNKPIYLHFTTTWCGWCRKIEKDVYAGDAGKKALADFVCASLDCTVSRGAQPKGETKINLDLQKKYGGEGYPYLVMLTSDGKTVLNTVSGYVPPEKFVKELDKANQVNKEYTDFQAYAAKADKESYDFNARAMDLYSKTHMGKEATEAARKVLKLDDKNAKGNNAKASLVILENLPADATAADAKPLADRIRTLDPKNEKHALEKAVFIQANLHFAAARTLNVQERTRQLTAMRDLAKEMIDKFPTASNIEDFYIMALNVSLALKDFRTAVDMGEKLLKVNPDHPAADQIKDAMVKWRAETRKQAATRPATRPAARATAPANK